MLPVGVNPDVIKAKSESPPRSSCCAVNLAHSLSQAMWSCSYVPPSSFGNDDAGM